MYTKGVACIKLLFFLSFFSPFSLLSPSSLLTLPTSGTKRKAGIVFLAICTVLKSISRFE